MQISSCGQVTIPLDIREQLGLLPNTEIEFEVVGDVLHLRKKKISSDHGSQLVALMRGKATTKLSTDEIMMLTRHEG
ncbi:MAG: AbrB/MazE/SpoVT family DNA-binding domain-containing protein [Cyanothece sp. SIO1E1]|nr:AbrB/MazE/SpoVT family DNA-binding domain-containing protein [Cyanothece sp. SIO1E1]